MNQFSRRSRPSPRRDLRPARSQHQLWLDGDQLRSRDRRARLLRALQREHGELPAAPRARPHRLLVKTMPSSRTRARGMIGRKRRRAGVVAARVAASRTAPRTRDDRTLQRPVAVGWAAEEAAANRRDRGRGRPHGSPDPRRAAKGMTIWDSAASSLLEGVAKPSPTEVSMVSARCRRATVFDSGAQRPTLSSRSHPGLGDRDLRAGLPRGFTLTP